MHSLPFLNTALINFLKIDFKTNYFIFLIYLLLTSVDHRISLPWQLFLFDLDFPRFLGCFVEQNDLIAVILNT